MACFLARALEFMLRLSEKLICLQDVDGWDEGEWGIVPGEGFRILIS